MAMEQAQPPLLQTIRDLDPHTAAERLSERSDEEIGAVLTALHVGYAVEILEEFPEERRQKIAAATPAGAGLFWLKGDDYPDGTVGRLIERPPAVFRPEDTIAYVTETLREIVKKRMVVYIFVTESDGHLVGLVAFRELLFAHAEQKLADIMIQRPFALRPEAELVDAMREVVTRHYPVYPVVDQDNHLLGMVRGQVLFEQQAYEISAQAGSMVGVEKEERLATPWTRSFKFRHPWLQLNLFTAFIAATVVGFFEETINQIVILAVFLPVLAGQSGNTGCLALAVTLRGMTLGELRALKPATLMLKEAWLGLANGLLVGLVAAAGMFYYASSQHNPQALYLAMIVVVAMAGSCVMSGLAGVAIPVTLRKLGADPATASSIFLTTATDVVSMGTFLGLATLLLT
jgi:magnesium transporter